MDGFDSFGLDAYLFEHDVHLLILGTLSAAERMLSQQVDKELAEIKAAVEKYGGNQRLDDDWVDTLSTHSEQLRFLRNNGLVALVSHLYRAMRDMATAANNFVENAGPDNYRKGSFGKKGEWALLLNEYEERFKIVFKSESPLNFLRPMVDARNCIVHDGGKPYRINDDLSLDESPAATFPSYVKGEGWSAEVEVSQELLEQNIVESAALVRFLAQRLGALENAREANRD
jgi:hypothetical protein